MDLGTRVYDLDRLLASWLTLLHPPIPLRDDRRTTAVAIMLSRCPRSELCSAIVEHVQSIFWKMNLRKPAHTLAPGMQLPVCSFRDILVTRQPQQQPHYIVRKHEPCLVRRDAGADRSGWTEVVSQCPGILHRLLLCAGSRRWTAAARAPSCHSPKNLRQLGIRSIVTLQPSLYHVQTH